MGTANITIGDSPREDQMAMPMSRASLGLPPLIAHPEVFDKKIDPATLSRHNKYLHKVMTAATLDDPIMVGLLYQIVRVDDNKDDLTRPKIWVGTLKTNDGTVIDAWLCRRYSGGWKVSPQVTHSPIITAGKDKYGHHRHIRIREIASKLDWQLPGLHPDHWLEAPEEKNLGLTSIKSRVGLYSRVLVRFWAACFPDCLIPNPNERDDDDEVGNFVKQEEPLEYVGASGISRQSSENQESRTNEGFGSDDEDDKLISIKDTPEDDALAEDEDVDQEDQTASDDEYVRGDEALNEHTGDTQDASDDEMLSSDYDDHASRITTEKITDYGFSDDEDDEKQEHESLTGEKKFDDDSDEETGDSDEDLIATGNGIVTEVITDYGFSDDEAGDDAVMQNVKAQEEAEEDSEENGVQEESEEETEDVS